MTVRQAPQALAPPTYTYPRPYFQTPATPPVIWFKKRKLLRCVSGFLVYFVMSRPVLGVPILFLFTKSIGLQVLIALVAIALYISAVTAGISVVTVDLPWQDGYIWQAIRRIIANIGKALLYTVLALTFFGLIVLILQSRDWR